MFIFGSIVIVVFVALLLGGIRVFLFPIWEANSEGVRQVATAQAQISAASTREALTPVAAPIVPTVAPRTAHARPHSCADTSTRCPFRQVNIIPTPLCLSRLATPTPAPTATQAVLANSDRRSGSRNCRGVQEVLRRKRRRALEP